MRGRDLFTLWDGPEYKSGAVELHPMTGIQFEASFARDVRHEDALELGAPSSEPWVDAAVPGTVVRHEHVGTATEWWVAEREDELTDEIVRFKLDPFHAILADVGPLEATVSPFVGWANLGLCGSARNFIATFIIPWLTAQGVTYIAIGTMDSDEVLDFRFDVWTPQQLFVELARRTSLEWDLRRDAAAGKYKIDLVTALGSSDATAWAAEALNLQSLMRRQDRERMCTVLRPVGELASGDERRADISQNAWKVTAISGDDLTLAAHNGRGGPVGEDDQWIDNYLEDKDGNLRKINDSVQSTQVIKVDTGLGTHFAVGDDVSIARNSSGDPLTEIESPSAVALYGRIAGPLELVERGERNWLKNPLFSDWTESPAGYACRKDGTVVDGTSIALKDLPADLVVSAGDLLIRPFFSTRHHVRVTVGGTVPSSGTLTVTIATSQTFSNNYSLTLMVQDGHPNRWARNAGGSGGLVLLKTPRARARSISCKVNGDQTFSSTTKFELPLKNLGASTLVPAGALITAVGVSRGWIVKGGTADASGNLTVTFMFHADWLPRDDDDLVLETPDLGGWIGTDVPGCVKLFSSATNYLDQDFSVRFRADREKLYVTAYCRALAALGAAAGGWVSGDGGKEPPELQLITTPSTVVASQEAKDWSPSAVAEDHAFTMQCSYPMTATDEFRARVKWPIRTESNGFIGERPWMWVEAMEVHLGPQKTVPVTEGSHATRMIQRANSVLADVKSWGATYEVGLIELAEVLSVAPAAVRVSLGALLRLRSDRLGIDAELRVMGFRMNPKAPEDMVVILQKRPHTITRALTRTAKKKLYARLDVTVDEGGTNEETVGQTVITEEEPPLVSGVPTAAATAAQLTSNTALTLVSAP